MADKKNWISFDITNAQLEDFFRRDGLLGTVNRLSNSPRIADLYSAIVKLEDTTYPQIPIKGKRSKIYKPIYKNFDEFKEDFVPFLRRRILAVYLKEFFKRSTKLSAVDDAATFLYLNADAILEEIIQYSYAEISNCILLGFLEGGHKPFDI